jgi:hypothetical protein
VERIEIVAEAAVDETAEPRFIRPMHPRWSKGLNHILFAVLAVY